MAVGRRWAGKWVWVLLLVAVAVAGGQVAAQAPARIDGMDVERVAALTPGTKLNFTVFGTPGADVLLHIDGVARPLPLREVQPGVYEGSQVLAVEDRVAANARVRASLRWRGQVSQTVLAEPLLLDAAPTPPQVHAGTGEPTVPARTAQDRDPLPEPPSAPAAEPAADAPPDPLPGAAHEPRHAPAPVRTPEARALPWREARPAAPACEDCAVVESIRPLPADTRPPASPPGLLLGGLFGERVGQAVDRHVARVTGAVDRAVNGRPLDEATGAVEVILRLPDGQRLQRIYSRPPALQVGDRVRRTGDMGGARRERLLGAPPASPAGVRDRPTDDQRASAGFMP
jgi:hypothetical protein